MPVPFAEYLEAKFALDERSLNRAVRAAFLDAVRGLPRIECLDVGAGTGATFRRLLHAGLTTPLSLTALDRDRDLLDIACQDAEARLRALGREPRVEDGAIQTRGERHAAMHVAAGELRDHRPERLYNVITTHAFLDLCPLPQALQQFAAWLHPGGYLYASINYDGDTALAPPYEVPTFEAALLRHYNDSMELRRVDDQATGGAYCGRRLQALLPDHAFDIVASGRSDWNIGPFEGEYRDGDAICLQALLDFIGCEGQRSKLFDADRLERWRDDRLRSLQQGLLGMRISHVDLLARYCPR